LKPIRSLRQVIEDRKQEQKEIREKLTQRKELKKKTPNLHFFGISGKNLDSK